MKCRELAAKIEKKGGKIRQKGKADCGKVFVNLSIARGRLQAAEIVNSTQRSGCELATHTRKYVANMHISIYQKPATHADTLTEKQTVPQCRRQKRSSFHVPHSVSFSWSPFHGASLCKCLMAKVCACVWGVCVWQTCIYWRGKLATVESQFATSIMQFKRARKKNRNRFKRIVCLFASHAPFARHAPLLALVAACKLFIFGKLIFRSSIFLHRTLLSRLVPHFAAHLSRTIFSFSRFSADSFACSTKQRPSQAWILANVDI